MHFGQLVCLVFCVLLSQSYDLPWSSDKVALWADFGSYSKDLLNQYQTQFVAEKYDIISIEKCLGQYWLPGVYTETNFYTVAAGIRNYSTSEETKVLFYWNIPVCYCDCYEITQSVLQNQSMWYLDDNGDPIYNGFDSRPTYDLTQEYVRNWWVQSLVSIIQGALDQGIIVDGVFVDGLCNVFAGQDVSKTRVDEYNVAVLEMLDSTRVAFSEINSDLFIFGNGLMSYPQVPDHCASAVSHVDGLCIEHFGAFEEVNKNGVINPDDLLMWFNLTNSIMNGDYGSDKFIGVKAWIGPETSPIDGMGPSWPSGYSQSTPTTYVGIQNASTELLDFPLAVYLCGIYRENVYFSYGWWYDIDQGYSPCPDAPDTCDCPPDWYQQFENRLGKPLENGVITDTYNCNRTFEHARISVDLSDANSAVIDWGYTNTALYQPVSNLLILICFFKLWA